MDTSWSDMFKLFKRCPKDLFLVFIFLMMVGIFPFYKYVVIGVGKETLILPDSSSLKKTQIHHDSYRIPSIREKPATKRAKSSKTGKGITFDFLSYNMKTCKADKNLLFAIIVHSSVNNVERRKTIRNTWVNRFQFRNITLTTVFLIGKTENVRENELLENEQNTNGDIIQGNFLDVENNQLQKGVMGYEWASEYCEYSDVVIIAKDYMFVNIYEYVINIFEKYNTKRRHIFCEVGDIPEPQKVPSGGDTASGPSKSTSQSKFCKSNLVIITSDLLSELLNAAEQTPVSRDADEHLYGVLPSVVKDITFVDLKTNITMGEDECLKRYQMKLPTNILACKADNLDFMYRIWRNSLKSVPKEKHTLFSNVFQSKIYNFARNYPPMKDYKF